VSDLSTEDAGIAADVIYPLIRRVAPGELTKSELVEQCGLDNDEIRAGVQRLLDGGRIHATEDGWAVAGAGASEAGGAPPPEDDDEGPAPNEPGDAPDPGSPGVAVPEEGYKAIYEVTVAFGGKEDEAAIAIAAEMEEEIADLLHSRYPHAVVGAEVKGLVAYRPRVIFGGNGGDADPT
jgi:hypothetical protein